MFGRQKHIYLDHAGATPVLPAAKRVVARAVDVFANPGGLHAQSVAAKRVLEDARAGIARDLACKPREVIFTSGLTEANNIAIIGAARALERARRTLSGTHWIVASIEHSSVLACFAEIERMGGTVTYIDPDERGIVAPKIVSAALRPETVFVSVGWANNEIGVVQSLGDIARVIRAYEKAHDTRILFHADAGQAPLYKHPRVHTIDIDLFSLGSGKLYGPRGIGALYIGSDVNLVPIMHGGGQERGLRSGTEDIALAAGFAKALAIIAHERELESKRVRELRDELAREIVARIPGVIVNGDLRHILPHILNISVPGEKTGEYLALQLDHAGIAVSTKSACDEGNKESHVVAALGGASWRAINTIRFSLGQGTVSRDVRYAANVLMHIALAA